MPQRASNRCLPPLSAVAFVATAALYFSSGSVGTGVNAFAISSCAITRQSSTSTSHLHSASRTTHFRARASTAAAVGGLATSISSRTRSRCGGGVWQERARRASRFCRRGLPELRSSDGGGDGEEEDYGYGEEFESIFNKNSAILDAPLEVFDEMDVEPLAPGTTRREMPVFMLDVAACPGGVVPLHIFEMRYRQMFNDIGTKDNRFGMLVSDPTTGRPCKYGSVMECAQRKLLPDGRQYVLNAAVDKFRVLKVVKSAPYTVMEVEVGILDHKPVEGEPSMWGADEGTQLDDLEDQVFTTVNSVVKLMNKLSPPSNPKENRTLSEWFIRYSPEAKAAVAAASAAATSTTSATSAKNEVENRQELEDVENERRMKFSYAVAEMISMPAHTKQLLLQSRSTAYRLMAEREILIKAQKELAARSSLKDTLG